MKWKLEIYVAVRKYIPVKMDENLQKKIITLSSLMSRRKKRKYLKGKKTN